MAINFGCIYFCCELVPFLSCSFWAIQKCGDWRWIRRSRISDVVGENVCRMLPIEFTVSLIFIIMFNTIHDELWWIQSGFSMTFYDFPIFSPWFLCHCTSHASKIFTSPGAVGAPGAAATSAPLCVAGGAAWEGWKTKMAGKLHAFPMSTARLCCQ